MTRRTLAAAAVFAVPALFALTSVSRAQEGDTPYLIKSTLQIKTYRITSYTAPGGKKVLNQWCWKPRVFSHIRGPVGSGTQAVFEFTLPSGKPWITASVKAPEIEKGDGADVELDPAMIPDEKAAIETGMYGVRISLKNELEQKNLVLFTGKLKVGKFHVGNNLPQFKDQFEYWIDYDWLMPIGYLGPNVAFRGQAPPLTCAMWFKQPYRKSLMAHAYLFYKGKQICNTEDTMKGTANKDFEIQTNEDDAPQCWKRVVFSFNMTATSIIDPQNLSKEIFPLDKNPGEYEVRVFWDGMLARSLKFKVGDDGKIVDPGVSVKNKIGGYRTIFPVKILGMLDSPYNADAWKTDAFFFNPLEGFTPAP